MDHVEIKVTMKNVAELLMSIISQEINYVESIRNILREDKITILRLQNKSKSLEKEIEERKKIIIEFREYLKNTQETYYTETKPSTLKTQQNNFRILE